MTLENQIVYQKICECSFHHTCAILFQEEELHESTDLPQPSNTTTSPDDPTWIVCEGEKVRVCSNESVATKLKDDIVGWNDELRNVSKRYGSQLLMLHRYVRIFNKVLYHNNKKIPSRTSDVSENSIYVLWESDHSCCVDMCFPGNRSLCLCIFPMRLHINCQLCHLKSNIIMHYTRLYLF